MRKAYFGDASGCGSAAESERTQWIVSWPRCLGVILSLVGLLSVPAPASFADSATSFPLRLESGQLSAETNIWFRKIDRNYVLLAYLIKSSSEAISAALVLKRADGTEEVIELPRLEDPSYNKSIRASQAYLRVIRKGADSVEPVSIRVLLHLSNPI